MKHRAHRSGRQNEFYFIAVTKQSRLEALPEIKKQFQQMKQELERVVEATITTASEISEESLKHYKSST